VVRSAVTTLVVGRGAPLRPPYLLTAVVVGVFWWELARAPLTRWVWNRTGVAPAAATTVALAVIAVAFTAAGWRWWGPSSWRPTRARFKAGAATWAISTPIAGVLSMVVGHWAAPEAPRPITSAPVPLFLTMVVVGPVIEELVFRGWLQGALTRTRLRSGGAIAVTAVAFGAAHVASGVYGATGFTQTAVSGVAYGVVTAATGSLIPSITAHAVGNLMAVAQYQQVGDGVGMVLVLVAVSLAVMGVVEKWRDGVQAARMSVAAEDPRWVAVRNSFTRLVDQLGAQPRFEIRPQLPRGVAAGRLVGRRVDTLGVSNRAVQALPTGEVEMAMARSIDEFAHPPARRVQVLRGAAWVIAGAAIAIAYGVLMAWPWLLLAPVMLVGLALVRRALAGEARHRILGQDRRIAVALGVDAVADDIARQAAADSGWWARPATGLRDLVSGQPSPAARLQGLQDASRADRTVRASDAVAAAGAAG
jgi:membrane protease YdiL (CAAX protease family)